MSGDAPVKPINPIKDASTVIVLRDVDDGIETFLLCRHQQSGFMGGAHVFPFGNVNVFILMYLENW